LLCLLLSSLVYYAYIDVYEMMLKREASLFIKEKRDLCVLHLSQEQFDKSDKEEINVNGSLYDVQSYSISNSQVNIVAYQDVKEESFLAGLVDIFNVCDAQESNNSTTHFTHKVPPHFNEAKYFANLYYSINHFISSAPLNASPNSQIPAMAIIELTTPPPKA
jgi:hypothetical protein